MQKSKLHKEAFRAVLP